MTDKLLIGASLLGMTVLNGSGITQTPLAQHAYTQTYSTQFEAKEECIATQRELLKRFKLDNLQCVYVNN